MQNNLPVNKRKIVNDPVYGFIKISSDIIFDLIEHPYFQRLRRIKQLGLTNFVYPGANHTRFQHALGSMHLMSLAIDVIRNKGHEITDEEAEAVTVAILLHDIGHGPFSHALELTIVDGFNHELLSSLFMEELNIQFNNKIKLAIEIFKDHYHKHFLHQLVSSQLDMDRLDYLSRDSFFTGVSEGVIGSDRIIKMLDIVNDELVIEAKGIYSIEKFLVARRLMYWQVYLHKTVISAEKLLVNILKRVRFLAQNGISLFTVPSLHYFIYSTKLNNKEIIENFYKLDDNDIMSSIKVWTASDDYVLSQLCEWLVNRKLYRLEMQNYSFERNKINVLKEKVLDKYPINKNEIEYFVFSGEVENTTYSAIDDKIKILYNNGKILDISEASDVLNISVLDKLVKKRYLCYPKDIHN